MLDAGRNRGTYFIPDIDDEVLIGFETGDPSHPVVLACSGIVSSDRLNPSLVTRVSYPELASIRMDAIRITLQASQIEARVGSLTVNAGISRFSGTVQCDTLITNSVVKPT